MQKTESRKITSGTKEWSKKNCNIGSGCPHDCLYCVSEDTKILMSDLTEKEIKEIQIGDKIIGLRLKKSNYKEYIETEILNKWETLKKAYKIKLDDGSELICSGDHRWLTKRGWKFTIGEMQGRNRRPYLTLNNKIMKLYTPLNKDFIETEDYKKGYLAGMIKGDGHLKKYDYSNRGSIRSGNGKFYERYKDIQYQFRLAVRDIECLLRSKKYLLDFNVKTSKVYLFSSKTGLKPIYAIRTNKERDFQTIKKIIETHDTKEFYRGFVSGLYDAEGTVDTSPNNSMRISNKNLEIISLFEKGLANFNFASKRELYDFKKKNIYSVRLNGDRKERIRFLQIFNPSIKTMKRNVWKGTMKNLNPSICEIIPLNKKIKMIDIETKTGNFIANGCISHNCYAKKIAIHYKRKTEETWKVMALNFKAINKGYRKIKNDDPNLYDYMFPSSHDILPEILDNYLIVLKKLLKAGNSVLIVSKPWPYCIDKITNTVRKYKDKIGFRFTITSTNKTRLAFWQPNAPDYNDMMTSLIIAFVKGFTTSVSIEPNLDSDPTRLILNVAPYVTESIWFGKMNYIKAEGITEEEKPYYLYQRKISSWPHIQKIIEKIKLLPEDVKSKIRIKDSIVKMYKKHGIEVEI